MFIDYQTSQQRLMIQIEILEKYDAIRRIYKKSEIIFEKDTYATHYYQIISGSVKMNNFNDEGRELVQVFFIRNNVLVNLLCF